MMDTFLGNEPPQRLFGQAVALWPDPQTEPGTLDINILYIYIYTHT